MQTLSNEAGQQEEVVTYDTAFVELEAGRYGLAHLKALVAALERLNECNRAMFERSTEERP